MGAGLGLKTTQTPFYDISLKLQRIYCIRHRAVTVLDTQLDGTELFLLDLAALGVKFKCPKCGDATRHITDKGFCHNATGSVLPCSRTTRGGR